MSEDREAIWLGRLKDADARSERIAKDLVQAREVYARDVARLESELREARAEAGYAAGALVKEHARAATAESALSAERTARVEAERERDNVRAALDTTDWLRKQLADPALRAEFLREYAADERVLEAEAARRVMREALAAARAVLDPDRPSESHTEYACDILDAALAAEPGEGPAAAQKSASATKGHPRAAKEKP